jgi:hypothetical protein
MRKINIYLVFSSENKAKFGSVAKGSCRLLGGNEQKRIKFDDGWKGGDGSYFKLSDGRDLKKVGSKTVNRRWECYERQTGFHLFGLNNPVGPFTRLGCGRAEILQLLSRSCPTVQNL